MERYVARFKERYMRYTKDLLGKTIADSHGFFFGKVDDIILNILNGGYPSVEGIVSKQRRIKWNDIAGFDNGLVLNKRVFELHPEQFSVDDVLFGRHILDEQLVDHEDRCIGRVDDLALMYDGFNKIMRVVGICSGAAIRMGFEKNYDVIPWTSVDRVRFERPKAVILRKHNKQPLSLTTKIAVYPIVGDYFK